MGTIVNFNKLVQAIDIDAIIHQSIDETKDRAAQFNRDDLSVGLLATSNPITPAYSAQYANKKGFTTPNLYDKGPFYAGIFANVGQSTIDFGSTDIKAASLEARYTKFIYGLTQDSKSAYSLGTLRPILNKNLKTAIGL